MTLPKSRLLPFALFLAVAGLGATALAPGDIVCEGSYHGHLQGIATDGAGTIFWSFTKELVKTDITGKVLKVIPVPSHHGDLTYHNGKVYVAVELGSFSQPEDSEVKAKPWVYVYDARDLTLVSKHSVPECVYGAGGIAHHEGRFIIIGGLPKGPDEKYQQNYAFEYDSKFRFKKRYVLKTGYTYLGVQTVSYAHGHWWFGCYRSRLYQTDDAIRLTGQFHYDGSVGMAEMPNGKYLIGRTLEKNRGSAFITDEAALKKKTITPTKKP